MNSSGIDSLLYFFSYANIIVLPILLAVLAILAIAIIALCAKASRYLDAKTQLLGSGAEFAAPAAVSAAPTAAPAVAPAVAPAAVQVVDNSVGHVTLDGIEDKDAATVMAIVANKLGTENLRFASIRRV